MTMFNIILIVVVIIICALIGYSIYASFKSGNIQKSNVPKTNIVETIKDIFSKEEKICTTCGSKVKPKRNMKGSFYIEVILWIIFIIPGVIYSIWRLSTKSEICPKCKNATMIPLDTLMAEKILSGR